MEAALGSFALTVAAVLYLAITLWDTKVAPPLDLPDPDEPGLRDAAARPH